MELLIITQKVDLVDPILGFFHRWIEKFAHHFERVEVIALEVREHNLPANVSVHSLGKEKGYGRLHRAIFYILYSIFLRYDAVFVHMNPEYLALFGWYWKLMGKRTALWYTHKSVTWWLCLAEKFADKIFTASRESFRLPSRKVEIIGHGIEMELFIRTQEHKNTRTNLRLLSVGRIASSKDLETIIRAAQKLSNDGIQVTLDIVGAPVMGADFEYEKALHETIKNLNPEDVIKFLGPKNYEGMPKIYGEHDLLIHTSKTGSVDKVVLEALACGTPVISSSEAFHDLPEYLRFKENDVEDLASKIINFTQVKPDISKLTELVRSQSNLDTLIKKISNFLNSAF